MSDKEQKTGEFVEQLDHFTAVSRKDVGDPTLSEVRTAAIVTRHDCVQDGKTVPFTQHVKAAEYSAREMIQSLAWRQNERKEQLDLMQPFFAEVTLLKERYGKDNVVLDTTVLAKKRASVTILHHENLEDKLTDFLSTRLPQLLWGLRKTFCNKKGTHFTFSLEFSVKEDSAQLRQLQKVVEGLQQEKREKSARDAGLIVPESADKRLVLAKSLEKLERPH